MKDTRTMPNTETRAAFLMPKACIQSHGIKFIRSLNNANIAPFGKSVGTNGR